MSAADLEHVRAALAGRFAVERELGQGGMSLVYLARDMRHDRPVAVKILRPDIAAALGGSRFLREIQIAARLAHPHIVPLWSIANDPVFTPLRGTGAVRAHCS